MNLYAHQKQALDSTRNLNRVAFFHPMGSGKTFTGSEKLKQLDSRINLVICQKSMPLTVRLKQKYLLTLHVVMVMVIKTL